LNSTSRALKAWANSFLSDARQKLHMAQEVILRLDEAQDFRQLSDAELSLRSKLKKRILGWLVIEKARKKQSARILHIREGDANTRFFHLRANGWRRKNYIHQLKQGNNWAFTHQDKQQILQRHFESVMEDPHLGHAVCTGKTYNFLVVTSPSSTDPSPKTRCGRPCGRCL
jgi:hypothetical protein